MDRSLGVTEYLRSIVPEWSIPLFEVATLAGDLVGVIAVVSFLVAADLYRWFRGETGRPLSRRVALIVAIVLGGLALTLTLKSAFDAPRPPPSLHAVPQGGSGFPSGHTMAATVLWGSLVLWSRWGSVRVRLLLASAIVCVVALTRLVLGVHYLVDVLASIGFGAGYLLVATYVTGDDPTRAFLGAAVLGTVAVAVTGGSVDGWLAFVGCTGGAVGWWVLDRVPRSVWLFHPGEP